MGHNHSTASRFGIFTLVTVLGGAWLLASEPQDTPGSAQQTPFAFYFDDGPLIVDQIEVDGTTYVSLVEVVRRLAMPYTDATARETFTIRGPNGILVTTRDSNEISIDGETRSLASPVLREQGRWFVPVEFLVRSLGRVAGVGLRHRDGAARILASNVAAPELTMSARQSDGITRLTIQSSSSMNLRVQQNRAENRVVLAIDRSPMDPVVETLAYQDASIRAVGFDDSDGRSKIVIETTPRVVNIRLVPSDENRRFFVEFVRESEANTEMPARSNRGTLSAGSVRVIAIDPGHGGLDSGTHRHGVLEKDLALDLARKLRSSLRARLGATVILTRDADLELNGETRAAIANNNKADLLISLHLGYSNDPTESGASIFLVETAPDNAAEQTNPTSLFRPWYRVHQDSGQESLRFATIVKQKLVEAVPGWMFTLRKAPISTLTSAAMPALLLELGNANNEANLRALGDAGFQGRLIDALVEATAVFGTGDGGGS